MHREASRISEEVVQTSLVGAFSWEKLTNFLQKGVLLTPTEGPELICHCVHNIPTSQSNGSAALEGKAFLHVYDC